MKKKTIKFESLKVRVNELLSDPDLSVQFKYGVIAIYEYSAHSTGNYNGFMFLNPRENLQWDTQEHVTRKYF